MTLKNEEKNLKRKQTANLFVLLVLVDIRFNISRQDWKYTI